MTILQLVANSVVIALGLCGVMMVAWRMQQRTGKSGLVDSFWTFGVGAAATIGAVVPISAAPSARQLLVAALAAVWSIRLGSHILRRNRATGDDPRYRDMIEEWGASAPRRMFWFLQSQAAVGVVFALAIAVAAHNPMPGLPLQDYAGSLVGLIAVSGEALADHQLKHYRADPRNAGTICNVGLWRWSRHPNYFFEWLYWCAFPLIAVDLSGHNPLGWFALAAPIVMYWLLVHVSGIPPLEQHMVRTRRAAFRAYAQQTSKFFPFPPRG
jgi:steroid 5-alpha reductase family enzyme